MYRHLYLSILLIAILCACTPVAVQQTTAPQAPPPPPPTLLASEIDIPTLVVTDNPLIVRLSTPIFDRGAVLPNAEALEPLTSWFNFLQRNPASHWKVKILTRNTKDFDAKQLVQARADILRRLIERQGLDPNRFEIITSVAMSESFNFILK